MLLGSILPFLGAWPLAVRAQTTEAKALNAEILKRLEHAYIDDLNLSELNDESREKYLNLTPKDLLTLLNVDEGTVYVSQDEMNKAYDRGGEELSPPIFQLKSRIAIVRYSAFNVSAAKKTRSFFDEQATLNADLKGIIIDLRDNSGGLFQEIKMLADLFIKEGLIFSIVGRDPTDRKIYHAHDEDIMEGKPIIILTNNATESGAAILAKALQNHGRAKVYGQESSKIATIQSLLPLGYGREGALKISTHKIQFAKGENGSGFRVEPDIIVEENVLEKAIEDILTAKIH